MSKWLMILGCVAAWVPHATAENWADFRGPTGQGVYTGKPLPLEYGPGKNEVWKTEIPGKGWSTPIVVDGQLVLTTATPGEGRTDQSLRAICVDADSGKILWNVEVFQQKSASSPRIHSKNSYASPSAAWDGERYFVHFGHEGTAALDRNGKILWKQTGLRYAPVHGNGSTPIVVDGKLIFSIDGTDLQALIALSCKTGEVVWKADRNSTADKKFSFATPALVTHQGRTQIVSPASDGVYGIDPATGKELWKLRYSGFSVIPKPVYGKGLVFIATGYGPTSVIAFRPEGTGDITDKAIAWTMKRGAPNTPSMLLDGDALYLVSDAGQASCLEATTGNVIWQERLPGAYSASPILAGDRAYFTSEDGIGSVVRTGRDFEILAKNRMGERTFASFVPVDGSLYVRGDKHLYRFQVRSAASR
ncbi:PQQ-binding-like beta-propeller repeat protein [Tuwongella immobilis]|uniref:Pyrrolo-quinoline quinone repeat domain-containing protein n=1 Tax=Tuwongella immobilis TaxID=692036 RepID=A0A6C2YLH2_9BACT|nr:PQQ-binding-like beta-propeller repeat protein [Tuwongella immobilis]VIP02276.1 Uncharacterized protein OS=Planctomyces maris DSM 8797 GN=PM8797T_05400 PE=4 SV=1: PQQ_3: PQQ_2 [Tuwongella immobilis]VTS00914.1 Uncharacterized protein OS=Planctomyces maris DSM 8797 GN=PM8797T_05400 PE=4 SV=1: PQQ_3: PQQ_2 [Tuwongella immobilis]